MEPEVRREYEALLRRIVLRDGTLVANDGTWYGWVARDYDHVAGPSGCPVSSDAAPAEETWGQFAGTFAEQHDVLTGVDLPGVSCACGKIRDRSMRIQDSISMIAEKVFEELYRQSRGDVTE